MEVAGSVSGKVGSHEQVDLLIHSLTHCMLQCQLPQTHLSLIACTWPVFNLSRIPCEPPPQLTNKLVWARWIDNLNVICNVDTVDKYLYPMKFKSQLTNRL